LPILRARAFASGASAAPVVPVDVDEFESLSLSLSVVDVVVERDARLSVDLPCDVEAVVVSGFFAEA
jgi:hypothetical protein